VLAPSAECRSNAGVARGAGDHGGGCQTTYDEHFDNPGGNHVTITACSPCSVLTYLRA
jgi:hypothetical protein